MWDYIVYILYAMGAHVLWNLMFKTPDPVKYYFKFTIYIIVTQIAAVITIPIMLLQPRNLKNGYLIAQILQHTAQLLGVTWHLRNANIVEEDRAAVVIANHQSSIDILGLYTLSDITKNMAIVCKKEVLYLGPFGLAAYLAGCIFIDRKNPENAHNTLKTSADVMFKKKTKICLFPEGTRNNNLVKMQPFKRGAFTLAIACQVPIIPVVISPYYFIDAKKRIFNKGHTIIQCLEAVPTMGLTMDDLPELKERVQNMMKKVYEELEKEVAITFEKQH